MKLSKGHELLQEQQSVYECAFPAGLAQSRWQRPGSSSNSSGPPWHTAVLEPALGQHTACLHLGQVRKEKPVEGTCKDGGCSQSRSKGLRQFLSDFGSPTDALHGLLTNISLAFPSPSSSPQNPLFLHVEKTQKQKNVPLYHEPNTPVIAKHIMEVILPRRGKSSPLRSPPPPCSCDSFWFLAKPGSENNFTAK